MPVESDYWSPVSSQNIGKHCFTKQSSNSSGFVSGEEDANGEAGIAGNAQRNDSDDLNMEVCEENGQENGRESNARTNGKEDPKSSSDDRQDWKSTTAMASPRTPADSKIQSAFTKFVLFEAWKSNFETAKAKELKRIRSVISLFDLQAFVAKNETGAHFNVQATR